MLDSGEANNIVTKLRGMLALPDSEMDYEEALVSGKSCASQVDQTLHASGGANRASLASRSISIYCKRRRRSFRRRVKEIQKTSAVVQALGGRYQSRQQACSAFPG